MKRTMMGEESTEKIFKLQLSWFSTRGYKATAIVMFSTDQDGGNVERRPIIYAQITIL